MKNNKCSIEDRIFAQTGATFSCTKLSNNAYLLMSQDNEKLLLSTTMNTEKRLLKECYSGFIF